MKLLAALALLASLFALPEPARCTGYCGTQPCYGSYGCLGGCLCMRSSPTEAGHCVSFSKESQ